MLGHVREVVESAAWLGQLREMAGVGGVRVGTRCGIDLRCVEREATAQDSDLT